jgi:hypothetical protein
VTGLSLHLWAWICLAFFVFARVFPRYRFHLYHQVIFLHHLHILFLIQYIIDAAELIKLAFDGHREVVNWLRWSDIPLRGDELIRYVGVIALFLLGLCRLLALFLLLFLSLLRVEESVILRNMTFTFDNLGSLPLFPFITLWVESRRPLLLLIMLPYRTDTHLIKLCPPWTILLLSYLAI